MRRLRESPRMVDREIIGLLLRHPGVSRSTFVLLGFLLGFAVTRRERPFSPDWFELAAQVIPVLLLALAVEIKVFEFSPQLRRGIHFSPTTDPDVVKRRLRNPRLKEFTGRLLLAPVLILLISAEVVALNIAGTRSVPSSSDQGLVSGAIVAGLVMIAVIAIMGSDQSSKELSKPSERGDTEDQPSESGPADRSDSSSP